MAVDPTTFKARFSEYSGVDDARIQIFIDEAVIILNESYWGTKYDLGVLYLSAHLMAMDDKRVAGATGATGPITARSVDGTSVSYGTAPATDQAESYYASTSYGQRYLALRKTLGVPAYSI